MMLPTFHTHTILALFIWSFIYFMSSGAFFLCALMKPPIQNKTRRGTFKLGVCGSAASMIGQGSLELSGRETERAADQTGPVDDGAEMSAQSAGSPVQTLQTVHERLHVAADFLKVLSILMFSLSLGLRRRISSGFTGRCGFFSFQHIAYSYGHVRIYHSHNFFFYKRTRKIKKEGLEAGAGFIRKLKST